MQILNCPSCRTVIMKCTRPNASAEALIVRMLDSDAFCRVLDHIECDAYLAVLLTCKAFNTHPARNCATSVRAVCATPAMLDWAIGIGFQPHTLSPPAADIVLKALHHFGTSVCSIRLL